MGTDVEPDSVTAPSSIDPAVAIALAIGGAEAMGWRDVCGCPMCAVAFLSDSAAPAVPTAARVLDWTTSMVDACADGWDNNTARVPAPAYLRDAYALGARFRRYMDGWR